MAITATITKNLTAGGSSISGSYTASGGLLQEYSEAIGADDVDTLVAGEIDVSQLQAWIIKCDTGVTVETNSGSSPADTITITANRPQMWDTLDGTVNPLTTDVTAFYITENDSTAGTLQMMFLIDPTV